MKKLLASVLVLLMALTSFASFAAAMPSPDDISLKTPASIVGFRSESLEGSGDWVSLSPNSPENVTSLLDLGGEYPVAAEYCNGNIYGYDFNRRFFTCDPDTLEIEYSGYTTDYNVIDMTYDATTDTMYAIGNHYLLTIDLTTGVPSRIARVSEAANVVITLSIGSDGNLYTIAMNNNYLYRLDKETAVATQVMTLPVAASNYIQGMTYDATTGLIYWPHWLDQSNNMLFAIDTANSTATELGQIGSGGTCLGCIFMLPGSDEPLTLDSALNIPGGTYTFTTTGDFPWFATEMDGRTVGSVGNSNVPESESVLRTTITINEGEMLEFDIKCSTEFDWDYFCFAVDSFQVMEWSGEMDWTTINYLPQEPGTYEFMWLYEKDDSNDEGEDCAWLDNVHVVPATESHTLTFINGITGETISQYEVLHGYSLFAMYIPNAPMAEGYEFLGWDGSWENVTEDRVITSQHRFNGEHEPGDVNLDGNITAADALLVLRHAVGASLLNGEPLTLADMNGDGNVTAADALIILRSAM